MANGRSCLVTGGAGFIGSHLVEALLQRGDRVYAIDNESTGNPSNLASVLSHPRLTYTKGSVEDAELLRWHLERVDWVFHLAAAVGVAAVASSPKRVIESNVYPVELLLRLVAEQNAHGKKIGIFLTSSSEVYGKNPKRSWTEDDDLVFGPTTRFRWSYGMSKALDEFLLLAYHAEHGLPVIIGRLFNVIGPRQVGTYGMVVPRFVEAALLGRPIVVYGDGRQVRCFTHVLDIVEAIIRLAETPAAIGQIVNIGNDEPTAIIDLAKKIIELTGSKSEIRFKPYSQAYGRDFEDCQWRVPDVTKLKRLINFKPRFTLEDALRDTIAWKKFQLGDSVNRQRNSNIPPAPSPNKKGC